MAGTAFGGPLKEGVSLKKYKYRNGMGMVPSAEFDVFHDDFHSFVVATAIANGPNANTPWGWQATVINTGATVVVSTTAGHATGVLIFDSDGTTEGASIYGTKSVQLTSGKKFFMEARVFTENADDSDVQIGLSSLTATTNPEDLWTTTATDLVAFGVLDGSEYPAMLADASNGGTSAQTQTVKAMQDNTWHTLAIGFDGTHLRGYLDGDEVLRWSGAAATIPKGVALAPFIGYRNGSSANHEGLVDYVRYVIER